MTRVGFELSKNSLPDSYPTPSSSKESKTMQLSPCLVVILEIVKGLNYLGFEKIALPSNHCASPGKAPTENRHAYEIVFFDTAVSNGFVEGNGT